MDLATVSLTMGLGLDGGFVQWNGASGWPRPEELADDMLALRRATLVDRELHADLADDGPDGDGRAPGAARDGRPRLVACDPLGPGSGGVLGRAEALRLLRSSVGRAVVHVAGGPDLARLALEADALGEIVLTIYPVTGHASWHPPSEPRLSFHRASVTHYADGRVASVWRRQGRWKAN